MIKFIQKNQIHFLFLILILFTQIYSPVISDDWFFHDNFNDFMPDRPLSSIFIIKIHQLIDYDLVYDGFKLTKTIYIFVAYFFLYKFYSLILDKEYAQFFSFFSIFYPIHDSANYQIWFIGHLLVMIIPLYSYYLFLINHKYKAYFLFALSSFFSYAALPTQFAIIVNEIKNNHFFKATILFLIISSYVIYYFFIVYYLEVNNGVKRVGVGLNNEYFKIIYEIISIENISIHLISFLDVLIGPSHILKIILPIMNNSLVTIILSILLTAYIYFYLRKSTYKINKVNFKNCFYIVILSLVTAQLLFIITTKFVNIPFGLGNRTNIYTSLFITFLFIFFLKFFHTKILIPIIFLFFLTFFGNLNYWKNTNNEIQLIKNEIINLSKINRDKIILLKNVEYIKLFKFKHIELFNHQIYLDNFIQSNKINTHNNSFYILKDFKIMKYNNKEEFILYDFEKKITVNINDYNELLYIYYNYDNYYSNRHWIQMIDFSYFHFLLPQHYKDKFINLTKRD